MDQNKRFNDLQKSILGISTRILSYKLKALELNCFVSSMTEHRWLSNTL
ncbi:winged helix-turn-helix transcriptional regulator [Mucilaginibacter sp.]